MELPSTIVLWSTVDPSDITAARALVLGLNDVFLVAPRLFLVAAHCWGRQNNKNQDNCGVGPLRQQDGLLRQPGLCRITAGQ